MSKAKEIKEQIMALSDPVLTHINTSTVVKQFNQKFNSLGLEGVSCDEVEVDYEGVQTVYFIDSEGDEMAVAFYFDEETHSAEAMILHDAEEDGEQEESIIVDLSPQAPPLIKTSLGVYVNLMDLSWMNKTTMMTIFQGGDIDYEEKEYPTKNEARMVTVVRGGKRVRIPIVKRKRVARLTAKQKAGFRKAARKRKAKKGQINRKRKRSMRIAKTVKRPKLNKMQKISGGRNVVGGKYRR